MWDECVVRQTLALRCSADEIEENIDKLAARLRPEAKKAGQEEL
jgi:hypothetical protein